MLKNYIKIAWRNLIKNKLFTGLNIIGLTIAFTVAILLSMAAFFELSYNNFHENLDTLYQVYNIQQTNNGAEVSKSHAAPLTPTMQAEIPGVKEITRVLYGQRLLQYEDKEIRFFTNWVDPDFFTMFSFPALGGNPKQALQDLNTIVLTKKSALKLFGTANVVGKTVNMLSQGKEIPVSIGAVLENIPNNSEFDFEVLQNFKANPTYKDIQNDWGSANHEVYITLAKTITPEAFRKSTTAFAELHYKEEIANAKRDGLAPNKEGGYMSFDLLPFKDIHFVNYSSGIADVSRALPYTILGLAFLVLFIACVNFINMSIANSGKRLREIGMRKTLGAFKKHLFFQFWTESLVIFLVSVVLGGFLSYLLLNDFQYVFQTNVSFKDVLQPKVIGLAVVIVLAVSFISGGYPAFLMSKLGTLQALKGKLSVKNGVILRNVLIVAQFSIAILLIIGTVALWSQLDFMKTKDLGYNKEQVISFPINGKKSRRQTLKLLRDELANHPNILGVTGASNNLGRGKDGSMFKSKLGFDYKEREVLTNFLVIDYDYQKTLDLELVAGRMFDRQFATDSLAVVINETMAKSLQEDTVLGKRFTIDSINYSIVGVVKDYHFEKLDKAIEPISIFMRNDWDLYYAYVKLAPNTVAESYGVVKEAYHKIEPNATFLGSFLDENIDRLFQREKKLMTMISSGSVIAIVLSCIGLFAMSLLIVSQRTKEIGIRKVVGASISSITYLLTKDFLKLVGLAFLIASPIAYFVLEDWLQDYAYRIHLSIWFFMLAGLTAALIALITIGTKTVSAAMQNPTSSLRSE